MTEQPTSHFDVLVVGAGISGIGAAYHLMDKCPGRTFAILEGRHDIGGTWDIFRYPGIRSDSDMHTLGYNFKPWSADKAIAVSRCPSEESSRAPSQLKPINKVAST